MANIKEPVANVGDSIARPHCPAANDNLNRISGFQVAASYNWLEKKNPTIMVPGVPPIRSPPPTTPVLKPDSGPRYVDQNTDRNPASPLDSLVLAVQTYQPDFNFAAIDVVSDRRPLRKLYGFVAGEPESFEFGVDIVGNTAIFVRIEKQTREELPSTTFHGFRQAFEEQYTKLSASAKGSTSHHRIVQYTFGGLRLLVRSAVDAYLEELVEGADSSVVTDSRDPLDHVNSVQNLSLGGRVATSSETENEVDGRVTVVQGGQKVPHAAVLELTTRSTFAKRPFVIEQKMADLWISQTPTFIEAYHRGVGYKAYNQHGSQQGRFEDIKVKSIGDLLTKWETTNAKVLGKLATVLKQVVLEVRKARSPCIVRYKGQGAGLGLSTIEALPSLSEDMKSLFQLKKPSLKKPEMTALKAGDTFPGDVKFSWVPYTEEKDSLTSCGVPQTYDASKEFAGKKVVLFAVPGAFTPGCSVRHLPGYIEHLDEIKGKGVDVVIVIAMNDAWVMSAWGKANGIKHDKILFMSDPSIAFSKSIGWTRGVDRTGRYAMVIDHGKIVYAENEPAGDVTVSGAEAVLTKL